MIRTLAGICLTLLLVGVSLFTATAAAVEATELVIVVMDPLAAPLSCPCVKGYAQRDYDRLGVYLQDKLRRPVRVVYNESLAAALRDDTAGKVDIVIGKHSVVAAYAQKLSRPLTPAFALAGKDGKTVMQGLFVVPAADPAKSVADLQGYRVIFGPSDCDEKHAAALALLKSSGVAAPAKLETCEACSDGATKILELGPKVRAATVISSYAAPLLEGCGTIQKGDLRVVGKTADVPFVELFIADALDNATRRQIEAAIGQMGEQPELLVALETRRGFVALEEKKSALKP